MLQRYNLEKPQSRLIAETGRLSQNAVFGVGVYSGSRKVGEGWGSAIRMAEYRVSRQGRQNDGKLEAACAASVQELTLSSCY